MFFVPCFKYFWELSQPMPRVLGHKSIYWVEHFEHQMVYFNFDFFFKYGSHSLDFYFYFGFFCEYVDLEIFNLPLHFNIWWYFRFWPSMFWFKFFILDTFIKNWFIFNFIIGFIILIFFNFITWVCKYFFLTFFCSLIFF
jgi:hypothetical protein